jgi:NAD(P)H-quinone oxidoreductase subunit 5
MHASVSLLLGLVTGALLASGLLVARWCDQRSRQIAHFVSACLGLIAVVGLAAAVENAMHGPFDHYWLASRSWPVLTFGVYLDSLSVTMLLLICTIGIVITRYSIRYLDGESTQGRFLRWVGFTIGAVLLLVVSRNLLMFTASWVLTSFGLHQLLAHYRHRPGALLAARKKFLISRLGDLMLVMAIVLAFREFGSLDYVDMFRSAHALHNEPSGITAEMCWVSVLLVMGAMTKSAQFPFHTWLPETMEAPTPVSALMHAGIINAGGFLVLRLSPVISLSQAALDVLALVGAMTASLGALVMLTQTTIKRKLAYSTVAQMGFMMLQCGLGAFVAALLHIVAHSLYKAHAFLNAGDVIRQSLRTQVQSHRSASRGAKQAFDILIAVVGASLGTMLVGWLLGFDFAHKPGGMVFLLVMIAAQIQLLAPAASLGNRKVFGWACLSALALSASYFVAYLLFERVLGQALQQQASTPSPFGHLLAATIAAGFCGVLGISLVLAQGVRSALLDRMYVHVSNGFYLDIPLQKLVRRVWQ